MSRRLATMLLAAGVASVLLPATAAHARCAGEIYEPGTAVCIATCVVYSDLAYC